ncbi:MAG: hypothetical protein WDM79_08840 [Terricaulis sp.]
MSLAAAHPNSDSLWRIAEDMLALMTLALGGPGLIAAIERLTRSTKRDILDWLAPLELLVRRLLLVEAAKLPRPAEPRAMPRALALRLVKSWQTRRKPRLMPIEPNRPSTWRVSFRIALPPDPSERKRTDDAPHIHVLGRPSMVRDIWRDQAAEARKAALAKRSATRANTTLKRLAQRFEAVRRVIADPAPHALRLARVLARKARAAFAAARRLADAPAPRRHRGFANAALVGAKLQARASCEVFRDSS